MRRVEEERIAFRQDLPIETVRKRLGRRSADGVLPAYELSSFMAWTLSGSVQEYEWIRNNMTELDLMKAFAMYRTKKYISLEGKD